ncbi:MAG: hypothetical protein R3B07_30700 [Polyangiaceae bacterium]
MSMRGLRRVVMLSVLGFSCISAAHAEEGKQKEAAGAPEGSDVADDVPGDADDSDDSKSDDKDSDDAKSDEDKDSDDAKSDDDAKADDSDEDEKEDPIVSLKDSREFRVVARSLRLKESSATRLREVANLYRKATRQKLVVTGGDRTAQRQAELMFKKLKSGEDVIKLYARTDLAKAIVEVYKDARAEGVTRKGTIIRMRKLIQQQMDEGQFISRHLNFTAADVRSRGLTADRIKALREAVKAVDGVSLIDERDGAAPCFHLSL